jgi:hypothetical protein
MKKGMFSRWLVCGITLLFILMSIAPSIGGGTGKISLTSSVKNNDEESLAGGIKVPDCIKAGDILIIDVGWDESNVWKVPGPYNEHGALYAGNNKFIEAGSPKGVYERNYSYFYRWTKNLAFVRVKSANLSQKQAAIDWAYDRIGAPYQVFFTSLYPGLKIANPNLPIPTAKKFYCMELPWAAYYNQGIDIDQNGWDFPCWVKGNDILTDNDIEIIYREVNDSTDIVKPNKAIYIANKKITPTFSKTLIFGKIDIEVVTLNENITRVDFYIDNTYKASDTTKPYKWTWDERVSGEKVIKAVACDDFGNQYSTNITVKKFF